MAEIPELSLRTQYFNPVQYNPTQYTAQTPSVEILQRSLANIETRRAQAAQQKSALDVSLAGVESNLNSAESGWFNNYKRNIDKQIQDAIDIGDYGSAMRTATTLAGETAKDTALLSRVKANEDYTKWTNTLQNRLDKGAISQDAFKWAMAQNPYSFSETKDINGNVVGGKLGDLNQVYDTINWGDVAAKAAAFNRPDVTQTQTGRSGNSPAVYDTDQKVDELVKLKGQLGSSSYSSQYGHSLEQVTSDEIFDTIGAMLDMPDLKNQAIQDYDVSVWNYQQQLANGSLNNADRKALYEQGLIKNGSIVPLQEYVNDKARLLVDALAYKKEGTTDVKESGFNFAGNATRTSSGSGQGGQGQPQGTPRTDARGNNVQMTSNGVSQTTVQGEANNINGMFQ